MPKKAQFIVDLKLFIKIIEVPICICTRIIFILYFPSDQLICILNTFKRRYLYVYLTAFKEFILQDCS